MRSAPTDVGGYTLSDERRPEVFLENQGYGAPQAWLGFRVGGEDVGAGVGKGTLFDGFGDNRTHAVPGPSDFADNDQGIRREAGDEHGDADAKIMGHLIEGLAGFGVTLLDQS